jgi:hypothetical protein
VVTFASATGTWARFDVGQGRTATDAHPELPFELVPVTIHYFLRKHDQEFASTLTIDRTT